VKVQSPLIRRLQGRTDLLPASHAAVAMRHHGNHPPRQQFLWADETVGRREFSVHAHDQASPAEAIARSNGIARGVTVSALGNFLDVPYYPFSNWLR
jgi:hypothetical protein